MKTISFRFKYEDKHLQDTLLEDSRRFVSNERLKQVLGNQWKEELGLGYQSWKGLSGEIKELKLKYRFPLLPNHAVFSKFHNKLLSYRYVF